MPIIRSQLISDIRLESPISRARVIIWFTVTDITDITPKLCSSETWRGGPRLDPIIAWAMASLPIKLFIISQIVRATQEAISVTLFYIQFTRHFAPLSPGYHLWCLSYLCSCVALWNFNQTSGLLRRPPSALSISPPSALSLQIPPEIIGQCLDMKHQKRKPGEMKELSLETIKLRRL